MQHPTLPYPGGKARLAKLLVSYLPQHGRRFIDPCCGHGNMFWAAGSVCSYDRWQINDTQTAPLFEAIRQHGNNLIVPERSKAEYERQWDREDWRSRMLEPYLTRNGGGYGKSGACTGHGPTPHGYQRTIRRCCDLMERTNVKVTALDWQKLRLNRLTEEDTVFFDPPYYEADVRSYKNQFEHMAMVELLEKARFRWMLTEYDQPFYRKHLGAPALMRSMQLLGVNVKKNGERRTECVWKNY